MKKILISILLLVLTLLYSKLTYAESGVENDIKKLSLEQAVEIGINNSTDIKTTDLDIEIKEIELDKAKHNEKKYENAKDYGFSLGTVEGFQLDSNMFSKSAEYSLEEEKIKKNYKVEDIKYNVIRAYYDAIQSRDSLNVTKDNLKNIQRNRDEVSNKLKLGVASKSDLLMADISLDEAKSNVEKARTDFQKSLRNLNMTLNYPLETKLYLTSDFKEVDFDTDLEKDLEEAYNQRFDMIKMNHNYEIVKLDFETNFIKYPENTYTYKIKERNVTKIENLLSDNKRNIEFDIKGKYDAVISGKKQISLAKANVERAKEGLRLKNLSYSSGMCTILEVKQSTNQLYNAQLCLSSSISSYNLAILDYKKAITIGAIR
ncbi:TolC family protein [Tepidibacter hydrothermalis]|uniref:TolC family protein n=1 Tax=Tepidibacter hydrothermalis TaxID=3036126 RepID=A0ABY8EKM2_9FIRM|nr:TolC family protein [Tepidibacter hydrothermalis]WFD11790.1 TolC family protein [Tepidibacter hydrothermalis]